MENNFFQIEIILDEEDLSQLNLDIHSRSEGEKSFVGTAIE